MKILVLNAGSSSLKYQLIDMNGEVVLCKGVAEKICDEGDLVWVDKKDVPSLNLWPGDRIFLKLLDERTDFFSLKRVFNKS